LNLQGVQIQAYDLVIGSHLKNFRLFEKIFYFFCASEQAIETT